MFYKIIHSDDTFSLINIGNIVDIDNETDDVHEWCTIYMSNGNEYSLDYQESCRLLDALRCHNLLIN